jgi:hypothetical protein
MSGMDMSKASLPITVVAGIVVLGLGYWVNAQDAKIEKNADAIEEVEEEVIEQKLEVKDELSDIKTVQAINVILLQQIADDIKKMADDG